MSPVVEVVRTYLELRTPAQLRPAPTNDLGVRFVWRRSIAVDHYRRLYQAVGDRWYWHDRNAWANERLAAYLASPSIYIWEALVDDDSAGYFEIEHHDDDSVEIAYFGLIDRYFGRGLGKAMLTRAVEEAWALGGKLVWLQTCTLDSPHALPNYKARGFEEVRTETYLYQTLGPLAAPSEREGCAQPRE